MRGLARAAIVSAALAVLSACQSSEEQAQAQFESAMEWVEKGEVDRALIELRNVFKLNGQHREARRTYARLLADRGNLQEAYSHYLLLVEQYPDDRDARRELARIALIGGNWEAVTQHVEAAEAAGQVADDPVLRAVKVNLDYRDALLEERSADVAQAVSQASELVAAEGDAEIARRVIIDDLLRRQAWDEALGVIDAGLAETPEDRYLLDLRLAVLQQLRRLDDAETQLRSMLDMFPDEPGIAQNLLGLLEARDQIDEAIALLNERLDPAEPETVRQFVSFIVRHRGLEAAIGEVDRLIATQPVNLATLRATRAGLMFDSGDRDAGMSEMMEVLETAEPSDETRRMKVSLAYMHLASGDREKARVLVEEVLSEDPTQVAALKLRAGWLIDEDRPGDALVDLRAALNQEPRDPELMTLSARAHERAGNTELVGDMLSRAVEASGAAPGESLRYAEFLVGDDRLKVAEDVLLTSLRRQPGDARLLEALGNVYIRLADWPRLEAVIRALEQVDTDTSRTLANELTARQMAAQSRTSELNAFLEGLAAQDPENLGVQTALIRQELAAGNMDGVRQRVQDLVSQVPDRPEPRLILASIHAGEREFEEAEALLQTLEEEFPRDERVYLLGYSMEMLRDDSDAALAALDQGLEAIPGAPRLLWAKGGRLEALGDYEGAISVYETWYANDPGSLIAANNLASLLADHRDGTESVERAFTIARRLRGTEVPAFQATYGWILTRIGNYEEALDYLRPASEAFADNPKLQYHLAEAYAGLARDADALEAYRKAQTLLEGQARPSYLDRVEAEIARLEAGPSENSAEPANQ